MRSVVAVAAIATDDQVRAEHLVLPPSIAALPAAIVAGAAGLRSQTGCGRPTLYRWRIELNGFAVVGASLAGFTDREYPFEGREGFLACSLKGGDLDDTVALEDD
jgi:hypothetical protein